MSMSHRVVAVTQCSSWSCIFVTILFGSSCFEAYLVLGTTTATAHAPLWCLFNQFISDVGVRTDANTHAVIPPLQMCWWLGFPGVQITFPQTKPGKRENHKVETCATFSLIKTACFIFTLLSLFTSSTSTHLLPSQVNSICSFSLFALALLLLQPRWYGLL